MAPGDMVSGDDTYLFPTIPGEFKGDMRLALLPRMRREQLSIVVSVVKIDNDVAAYVLSPCGAGWAWETFLRRR